jgi:FAD/FMN-containing dehydrogenase
VIAPGDESYDRARTLFYGGMDRRPAVIIRPADADEVSRVVSLAAETGLDLAVRSGGHSIAGHSVNDGGIVLDLSRMRALDIDVEHRIASAQTGLTAGEYTTAAAEYGLGTGFGDTGSVGIGGITLGGGVGYLSREHGLTIDSLLSADVVTADGTQLHIDDEHQPDLFWAIRGGGGNFGVATRFTYRLHDVSSVVGGMLIQPATAVTIEEFMAFAQDAPEELSLIANVMPAPPMPFLPPDVHGQLVIMSLLCYVGDAVPRTVHWHRFGRSPLPSPTCSSRCHTPRSTHPRKRTTTRSGRRAQCSSTVSAARQQRPSSIGLNASDAQLRVAQLRPLGGAVARVPNDATAYAHRDREIMVNVATLCQDIEEVAARRPWVDEFSSALRDGGNSEAYVGFLGDEGAERVRDAYPGSTWDRLKAIKATYDPANLFHGNQNIRRPVDGCGRACPSYVKQLRFPCFGGPACRLDTLDTQGQGEAGLRLGRPSAQHPETAYPGGLNAGQPQRGLADPRLAFQHDRARQLFANLQKANTCFVLVVPADWVPSRHRHVCIMCRGSHPHGDRAVDLSRTAASRSARRRPGHVSSIGSTVEPVAHVSSRSAIAGLRARAGPCIYVPRSLSCHAPSVVPSLPTPALTRASGRRPGPRCVLPPWFSKP